MRDRVEQLDGLRGIFSILVIAHHHNAFRESIFYNNFFVLNASLFVDFFFVLSGFVIAMNYIEKIRTTQDFAVFSDLLRAFRVGHAYIHGFYPCSWRLDGYQLSRLVDLFRNDFLCRFWYSIINYAIEKIPGLLTFKHGMHRIYHIQK
jgi:hypothetical protein